MTRRQVRERTCADCSTDISNRDPKARFCHPCVKSRQVANRAAWEENNRDKRREIYARYRRSHPEKLREKERRRGVEKRAQLNEKQRRWASANPEKAKRSVLNAVRKNPEKYRLIQQRRRARLANPASTGVTVAQWSITVSLFEGRCAYCRRDEPLTIDHVVPISRGGLDVWENVVPACKRCNCSKNARLLSEWIRCPPWLAQFPFLEWLKRKLHQLSNNPASRI